MVRRWAFFAVAAAIFLIAVPAGASGPGFSGTTSCAFGGAMFFKKGLPLTSPGPAAHKYTEHVDGVNGATGCTTAANIVFDTVIVKLKGTSVTKPGAARPSCTGLAENPATDYKATLQFRRNGPKGPVSGTAKATLSTVAVSLGTPVSFDLAGTVTKGAFAGEHVAIHMAFDQQWPYLVDDCSDANGLKNLDMTAIFPSTFAITPQVTPTVWTLTIAER